MSSLVPTLAALLLVFVAGFGATSLFARDSQRIALGELIALAWLFGAALISLSLWLLGILLRGVPLQFAVTIISVGLGSVGLVQWRRGKVSVRIPWPRNWIESALLVLLCLQLSLVFVLIFKHTLGWDGLVVWELKARYAYLNGGTLPSTYFSDTTRAFSHPEYPLFLPMLEMWIYFWIGDCDQYWVKLIFPVFYAVGIVLLAQAGAAWSGKRWIGLLAANLFLFVPALTCMAGGIVLGYADVPLSIVYLAAFYFLFAFARQNSKASLSIFVALVSLLPWVKQDGLILWFVLALCGGFIICRRRGIIPAIVSVLPGLSILAGWQIYLHALHAHVPQVFLPLSFSILFSNYYRLGSVLQSLVGEITTVSHWSLLWVAAPIAFACLLVRRRDDAAIVLVLCCLTPLALYCCTYLFSASPDYLQHVQSSLPRLLLHVTPLSILSIALALAPPRNETPITAAG